MKKLLFMIITCLFILSNTNAQSKIYSNEDLKKSKEVLLYSDTDKDYYGVVKNGEVVSAYSKDKRTGAKENVSFEDNTDNKNSDSNTNNTPSGTMAKVNSGDAPEPKCTAYKLYDCEVVVGRDPATNTAITKTQKCVKTEQVECPKSQAKKNSNSIKAITPATSTKH